MWTDERVSESHRYKKYGLKPGFHLVTVDDAGPFPWRDERNVEINWSCIGDCDVERAEQFAECLAAAIADAKAWAAAPPVRDEQ